MYTDAQDTQSVASPVHRLGMLMGASRVALGSAFLAGPVASVRLLGLDTATATRVTWLARMAAVRDIALGAGAVGSLVVRRGQVPWLVAGTLTDAGDAAAIVLAVRAGRLDRVRGYLIAGGAVASAAAGLAAAAATLRRRG